MMSVRSIVISRALYINFQEGGCLTYVGRKGAAVVRWQLEHRPHPEQGYRACLGLQRLARAFGTERLEAACTRALAIGAPLYRSVDSILKSGVDRQPLTSADAPRPVAVHHDNVRGPDYYH
jgi:hypothetical protein